MWYILNSIFSKSYSYQISKNIPKIPKPSCITLIPKRVFFSRFSHRSVPCIGGARGWGMVHVVAKKEGKNALNDTIQDKNRRQGKKKERNNYVTKYLFDYHFYS